PGLGEDAGVRIVVDLGLGPVGGLVFGWRDVPELAVQSSVVVPVDVFGDGDLDITHVLPATFRAHDRVADALGFEQRVQGFGHRVVVGISLAANRCHGFGFGESFGVADGSILHSAVA